MSGQLTLIGDREDGRRLHDFYETARWQVEALLRRLPMPKGCYVLEPMAGELAIAQPLVDRGHFVVTNDLDPRRPTELHLDAVESEFWLRFAQIPPEVVAGNPAFKVAMPMIRQAHERAVLGVVMLLRITWLEPTEDDHRGNEGRSEWLGANPPTRLIVLPRYSFRGNGSTDSATCAWFVWAKSRDFCEPGIDIVTKREMRELMAIYGER